MHRQTLKLVVKAEVLIPVDDIRSLFRTWVVKLIRRVLGPLPAEMQMECIGKGLTLAKLPERTSKADIAEVPHPVPRRRQKLP
jgi:hypothetical protein